MVAQTIDTSDADWAGLREILLAFLTVDLLAALMVAQWVSEKAVVKADRWDFLMAERSAAVTVV